MRKQISILIPAYNEMASLAQTVEDIQAVLDEHGIDYNFVIVDDGSKDMTWMIISAMAEKDKRIKGIKLSRNFGKEGAMFAGLSHVDADCCVVMDSDGQHPSTLLPEMYRKWKDDGCDIVEAVKKRRGKETLVKRLFAKLFYKILTAVSGIDMNNASDFKLLDAKVIKALLSMPESQTFFRAMSGWTGFTTERVYFDVEERHGSSSKWSSRALVKFALNAIAAYSSFPMQAVTIFGVVFFIFSIVLIIQTLVNKLSGHAVEGFTTVIILLLIIGSIIMFSLGVIGFYISRIYNEIKRRPKYLIDKTIGFKQRGER